MHIDEVSEEIIGGSICVLHDAQTISHLVLSKHRLALRINFNVRRLKHGIRRFVNNL